MKILVVLIIVLVVVIFISYQKSDYTDNRVVIETFCTQGPPHDNGKNLQSSENKFKDAFINSVDYLNITHLQDLQNDEWWKKHFKEYTADDFEKNGIDVGWMFWKEIGFWKYKALLLYKAMQREPDDTLIIYMDLDVDKYPDYLFDSENIKKTAQYVMENCKEDIWIGTIYPEHKVKTYCKGYTVHMLSPEHSEEIFEKTLLECHKIIIKNTPAMRTFFEKEIIPAFENDKYISIEDDKGEFAHKEYTTFTGDQGVWNTILYDKQLKGEINEKWPMFKYKDNGRKFSIDTLVSIQ